MKTRYANLLLIPLLLVSTAMSLSAVEVGEKIAAMTTKDDKIYKNVVVKKVTPAEILIFHAFGVATIKVENLPDGLQVRQGSDPKKSKELPRDKPAGTPGGAAVKVEAGKPQEPKDLTTTTGKVFKSYKVTKTEPDGITIWHSEGIAKLSFTVLSADLQQQYGYDVKRAIEYQEKQEEQARQYALQMEKEEKASELRKQELAKAAELAKLSQPPTIGGESRKFSIRVDQVVNDGVFAAGWSVIVLGLPADVTKEGAIWSGTLYYAGTYQYVKRGTETVVSSYTFITPSGETTLSSNLVTIPAWAASESFASRRFAAQAEKARANRAKAATIKAEKAKEERAAGKRKTRAGKP